MMLIFLLKILERLKGNLIVLLRMKINISLSVKKLRLGLTKIKME